MKTIVRTLLGGLAVAASAMAQDARPPALLAKGEDGKTAPLRVDDLDVTVNVVGNVAETVMTLRFRNDSDRVLEGELVFPLGEGRTVSRYALEIDGKMREGVSIPKNRGRAVFESIVRQKVDPGLLEWTKGNNFRTRIYPIPAKGFKSVRVGYEEELSEASGAYRYRLPLGFPEAVKRFHLRVEVARPADAGVVDAGPGLGPGPGAHEFGIGGGLEARKAGAWILEAEEEDFLAREALEVTIPREKKAAVSVEKRGAEHFFYLLDRPEIPAGVRALPKPKSVRLVWDASHSGKDRENAKEVALLERFLGWLGEATVNLSWLRNEVEEAGAFTVQGGRCPELLKALQAVRYDGGTRLNALKLDRVQEDLTILVSDGVSTLGAGLLDAATKPLIVMHAAPGAEHGMLRGVATSSGGAYVNLAAVTVEDGFKTMTESRFGLVKVEVEVEVEVEAEGADDDGAGAKEIYPSGPTPVTGALGIAGMLTAGKPVTLALHYGWGRDVSVVRRVVVDPGKHRSAIGRVPRLWAQKKLEALETDAIRNREEIVDLGKRYGLVTRHTSLIVLDRIEDYVMHRIRPPEPEMQQEYERLLQEAPDPDAPNPDHLADMLELWKERCEWHGQKFPDAHEAVFLRVEQLLPVRARLQEFVDGKEDVPPKKKSDEAAERAEQREEFVKRAEGLLAEFKTLDARVVTLKAVGKEARDAGWEQKVATLNRDARTLSRKLTTLGPGETDETRAALLADVDQAWELATPDAAPGAVAGAVLDAIVGEADPFAADTGGAALANQLPPPATAADPFSDEGVEGRDAPMRDGADPFVGGGTTGNGSERNAADFNRPASIVIPGVPAGDGHVPADLAPLVTGGLRSGDSAITRESIDAILNNPNRDPDRIPADLAAEPGYEPPELPNQVGGNGGGASGIFPVTPATPGQFGKAEPQPKPPYLVALEKAADRAALEAAYYEWKGRKKKVIASAFYLDAADLFLAMKDRRMAMQALTNVAELAPENVPLMRILGHRLDQLGELELAEAVFREVKGLRGDEPQSWRDLALVLDKRGKHQEALDLLWLAVINEWDDRFPEVQMIALTELNALVTRHGTTLDLSAVDERFLRNLDCDLRVVLTWDADNTDIDLWVTDPPGERCYYGYDRTITGGRMSADLTDGYGPEEFLIRVVLPGTYRLQAQFYGNRQQSFAGATTVQAVIFNNWGRPNQTRKAVTLRLRDEEDVVELGAVSAGE